MKANILIIDDEKAICAALAIALKKDYTVECAYTTKDGIAAVQKGMIDVVLLDLRIGRDDGMQVLDSIKKTNPDVGVIIMTAYGSIRSSVEAMKHGAFSYLTKPLDLEEVEMVIKKALEFRELTQSVASLRSQLSEKYQYGEMIGRSPAMQGIYRTIEKVKDSDLSIIISGESGTGKELAARAVHYMGKRREGPFVDVNCAAIPEGLLEEELFGHKRGSFTGAVADRKGKFGLADKGTLFFDEIGELPLNLQSKLLRVLQQKEYSPIGGNEKIHIDVRIIAATNRSLEQMVREGKFREDLYYRLNVISLTMPPLRERKPDIPLLCKCFLDDLNRRQERHVTGVDHEAEQILMAYDYPGNVRELINIVEYAAIFTDKETIGKDDLPEKIRRSVEHPDSASREGGEQVLNLKQLERQAIESAMKRFGGKRKLAASALGISERGLRNKLAEYSEEQ